MTHHGSLVPSSFAVGYDGPFFGFHELSASGQIFQGISRNGEYISVDLDAAPDGMAFVVSKNRIEKSIRIHVYSSDLRALLMSIMESARKRRHERSPASVDNILKSYPDLKAFLAQQHQQPGASGPRNNALAELSMLVNDVLGDTSLYDGIPLEELKQRGLIHESLERDILRQVLGPGLLAVDACFRLGAEAASAGDGSDDDDSRHLSREFERYALDDKLDKLRSLCEKYVATGKADLSPNVDELLLRVLDRGHMHVFKYILSLEPTRNESLAYSSSSSAASSPPSISNDPLYVAIRLGHTSAVKDLLKQSHYFEGFTLVTEPSGVRYRRRFTPVSAAIYWKRADLVRIMLQDRNIMRLGGGQEALNAAGLTNRPDQFNQFLASLGSSGSGFPHIAVYPPTVGSSSGRSPLPSSGHSSRGRSPSRAGSSSRHDHGSRASPRCWLVRRHKPKHRRQALGHKMCVSLENLCSIVRSFSSRPDCPSTIRGDYLSAVVVWRRGLQQFHKLMKNQPPQSLQEVLDCLLVSSAVCDAYYDPGSATRFDFVNDLGRWKTVLPTSQHSLFEEFSFQLWACSSTENLSADSEDAMLLFQNTVLKLNTLEMRSDTSNASSPFARGAAFTTSTITSNMPPTGPQVVSPYDQSGMAMEGIIYSPSFIATGQLEALPGSSTNWFAGNYAFPSNLAGGPSQQSASAWDSSTSSISLVLLGSMAFTCTMALVLALNHRGVDPRIVTMPDGCARNDVLVREYLALFPDEPQTASLQGDDSPSHGGNFAWPFSESPRDWSPSNSLRGEGSSGAESEMQYLGQYSHSSHRDSSAGPSSRAEASTGHLTQHYHHQYQAKSPRSPSPNTAAGRGGSSSHHGGFERPTCQQCGKDFSTVTNLNKHLRGACPNAKQPAERFDCPNGCGKSYSTAWYQREHAERRCPKRRRGGRS